MARALDLRTVVDGVDMQAQAHVLRSLDAECAQGYLYSPAVPAQELLDREPPTRPDAR
jgi:sensor c-di-GMP phosphodiesterase-like protein